MLFDIDAKYLPSHICPSARHDDFKATFAISQDASRDGISPTRHRPDCEARREATSLVSIVFESFQSLQVICVGFAVAVDVEDDVISYFGVSFRASASRSLVHHLPLARVATEPTQPVVLMDSSRYYLKVRHGNLLCISQGSRAAGRWRVRCSLP